MRFSSYVLKAAPFLAYALHQSRGVSGQCSSDTDCEDSLCCDVPTGICSIHDLYERGLGATADYQCACSARLVLKDGTCDSCETDAECADRADLIGRDTCCDRGTGECSIFDVQSRGIDETALKQCACASGLTLMAADFACVCPEEDGFEGCPLNLDACPCLPNGEDCIFTGVCEQDLFGEPHMVGLRGQKVDWSGVNGGWYSMIKDENADLHINLRVTAPLPDEFPNRQLITGFSILSGGHSLAIEVKNPYTVDTGGCPEGVSPCLANGGLRAVVDGEEVNELLTFSRNVPVAEGEITLSASNLPVECRQFGGDKIWARMYEEMLQGQRALSVESNLEDWILRYRKMAAPEWCVKYIAENNLDGLQSTHAIFKIDTPTLTVRLNAGVNHQGDGELDWDGRVLPDLEFWQMDVSVDGLDVENPALSGFLGETSHPVYDESGAEVVQGFEAFRGEVEDYRVSGALGTHFALPDKKQGGQK